MKIRISGRNKKISKKEVKEMVKFYLKLLMEKTEYKDKAFTIIFEKMSEEELGYLVHDKQNLFVILNKKMNAEKQMEILAHELVHVKQYIRGEQLSNISMPDDVYWEHPSEIEAYGRSVGMAARYIIMKNGKQ